MTILLQRLHNELVRRHYATTTLEAISRSQLFSDAWGWPTTWVRTIRAAIRSYSLDERRLTVARSSHLWPRSLRHLRFERRRIQEYVPEGRHAT